jgi:alpha-glucosidase
MLGLPGSAYLYQGEELGLFEAADLPLDSLRDPTWFRTGNKSKGRDGCRVPLPWDSQVEHLGFGGPPWLPQPAWFAEHAVIAQDRVKDSTLEFYRSALAWRRRLQTAESLQWVSAPDAVLAHYRRPNGWEVLTNFGAIPVELPEGLDAARIVMASGALPVASTMVPAETTLWFTP